MCQKIIRTQDDSHRVGAQHVDRDATAIERRPGKRNVDQAAAEAGGRVGEVGFVDADVHPGMALVEVGGQAGSDPFGAVGECADGESRSACHGQCPCARLIGLVQQGTGVSV